jgi:DNA mismatch repair protein MutL
MLRDMSGPDPWQLRPTPAASPAPPYTPPEPVAALVADGADVPLFGRTAFYGKLRYVGQVRATFLVTEGPDGLYILDQHAAAERVTFDRLRADYAGRAVASQRLLVPEVVALAPAEYAVAEEYASEALGLGLDARPMSGSAVAVYSVPSLLPRASPERLVRDLVAEVGRTARRPFSDSVDRVLATMACHGSVRAGDILSPEEARELLVGLDAVSFAAHCPHGRPIVMRLGFDELERKVGR